jgi:tetratricopeptide (TPR) repeat protein
MSRLNRPSENSSLKILTTPIFGKNCTIYISQKKDFEKALIEAVTLADGKIESGHSEEAEEIYKTFVAGSPYFPPIRQKLAEFYISVSRPRDAATELLQAAELFVTEGDLQSARGVLTQAIEIAPDMPEAGERLEQLQTAGTVAPPAEPEFTPAEEPVPVAPSPVVPEPEPLPILETQPSAPTPIPVQAPVPAPATISAPPVAEVPAPPEEDPAIIEAFTEADVLIKYGLADKAVEQLEALRSDFPETLRIPIKLRDIYREQGNIDKAVQHALIVVALYSKSGREDQAAATLQETFEMAPDHPAVLSKLGRAPIAPIEPVQNAPEEILQPAIMQDHLETPLAEPEISPPSPEEITAETIAPPKSAQPDEIEFAGLGSELPPLEEPVPEETVPVAEPPVIEQQPVEEVPPVAEPIAEEQPSIERKFAGKPAEFANAPVDKKTAHEPPAEVNIGEIWAEAEFYFQQGLFDEAKKHYNQIIALTPGNQRASARLAEIAREENELKEFAELTDAVEGLEGHFPPEAAEGVLSASASDDEAVRSLMQEIQQLNQQPVPPAPPVNEKKIVAPPPQIAADAVSKPLEPAKKAEEEDLFDLGAELQREAAAAQQKEAASEDFFDLAAELSDELGNVPIPLQPPMPAEEQSLDDIFQEFKRGIEQQSAKEEVDTHYNLGVAYKEMGLLDDAIGEFLMTTENEPKFVQSRYMLGLCYMQKGEYLNAIVEIRNALDYAESSGFHNENRIEMHYDLGLACQCAGDISSAADEFQFVFDEDPGFRDTAAKLKDLQKGDFISLEQLKDDIEKEISSKFLEEGVRIEREEKTRKNERVGK